MKEKKERYICPYCNQVLECWIEKSTNIHFAKVIDDKIKAKGKGK